MALSGLDLAIIVVYLFGITAFGIAKGFRRNASPTHYFLADKSLGWFTVGAALFTSNISTIHLLGLAAGGAKNGLTIGNFEWMAAFTLILLALVFVPFYVATGIRTLPEFMERRYCPQARTFLAVVGVVGALLIHIGMSLFAGAELFQSFLGIPAYVSIVILSALTVAYTAAGGLKAVVTTENIQVCLLLISSALVTVLGLCALPAARIHDLHSFVRALPPGQLQMLQPITDIHGRLNEYSWLGALLGYPILGIWYWCADQTHVQRVLGANSLEAAQKGALFAGFLKITPVFLMVLPGIISYVLWHQGAYRLPFIPGTHDFDFNAGFAQSFFQLLDRRFLAFQIVGHLRVIFGDDFFHELGAIFFGVGNHVGWNFGFANSNTHFTFKIIGFHREQIHYTFKMFLQTNR